ncbi:MAG TPA: metallophosphoesterase [Polyangiaceae bacterium]|nr:metallophosphoesterase [Polyangiaceae bacterium]
MFRLVGLVALGFNWLLWCLVRRRVLELAPRARWVRGARGAALFALLFHPSLVMTAAGWPGLRELRALLPDVVLMTGMAIQIAALLSLVAFGLMALISAAFRGGVLARSWLARRTSAEVVASAAPALGGPGESSPTPAEAIVSQPRVVKAPVDMARRRIVAATGLAVPAVALAVSGAGALASRALPSVSRVRLPVRREMTSLHGITIAQVSDVHVGSYMDAARLDEIRDAMNALGADYHVITGDLLDNHVSQLELATRFIRGLAPRRGEVFLCMGNHEYIAARSADVKTIVSGLEGAGAQVLIDEARELRIGQDRIWMGALDYPPSARLAGRRARPTRESLKLALGQMRDDGAPRVLLSHHPRTYVEARELDFGIMLSGHTHGGQIKLGRIGDHAITPVLPVDFYHNGFYQHAQSRLYVNAGAGGWLPVRINCPPELTLVQLVAV